MLRQALAGMLWSKQFYHYDVQRWLDGDPAGRRRRAHGSTAATTSGRTSTTIDVHLDARHVGVPVVRGVGSRVPLRRARPRRPGVREATADPAAAASGTCTRTASCPPTSGRSATSTRRCTPGRRCGCSRSTGDARLRLPRAGLPQAAPQLHVVGQPQGRGGQQRLRGRLPRARQHRPVRPLRAARRRQCSSSPTAPRGWRCTASNLLEIALLLAEHDHAYEDLATKFFEHFALIASALNDKGLWDEEDGFYYDVLHDRRRQRRAAARALDRRAAPARRGDDARGRRRWRGCPTSRRASTGSPTNRPEAPSRRHHIATSPEHAGWRMLSIVDETRLRRLLGADARPERVPLRPRPARALDVPRGTPASRSTSTASTATLDYEPAESTSRLFGGNSNWRGPVWFPINYLLVETLRVYHRYLGDDFTVEFPTGSGRELTLAQVADELAGRLTGLFLERRGRPAAGLRRLRAVPGATRPGTT